MIRELIQLDNQDVDPRKLGGRALGLMQGSLCSQCLTVSAAHFDGFFFFFFSTSTASLLVSSFE